MNRDTGHVRDIHGTLSRLSVVLAGHTGHTPIGVSRVPSRSVDLAGHFHHTPAVAKTIQPQVHPAGWVLGWHVPMIKCRELTAPDKTNAEHQKFI